MLVGNFKVFYRLMLHRFWSQTFQFLMQLPTSLHMGDDNLPLFNQHLVTQKDNDKHYHYQWVMILIIITLYLSANGFQQVPK